MTSRTDLQPKIDRVSWRAKKLERILTTLSIELVNRAWSSFLVAQRTQGALQEKRINCMYWLFTSVYVSAANETIVAMVNLLDKDRKGESISVYYLLSEFEAVVALLRKLMLKHGEETVHQHLRAAPAELLGVFRVPTDSMLQDICNAIAQDRLRLETLAVIVEKLEIRRNRAIAHLDRVLINKPTEVWLTQPLDSRELLEILNELKRIIDRYYGFLGFDLLSIDNLHYYMNEDFEFLTKIIADANSAKLG